MVKQIQKKPRTLSRLDKLSLASLRRMGLKTIEDDLETKIIKIVEAAIADLKVNIEAQRGIGFISVGPGGIRSSPPPGSKKVKNLFVTPSGQFQVEFEDIPV